jgi:RimJ/RimL family protein N-acetyltransferase
MHLTTPRLVLREAEIKDVAALAAYQRDPRYLEHYLEVPDAGAIVANAIAWKGSSPRLNYQFIVELDGATIGCAGLRQAGQPPGCAEVGVEIDPRHWGAGYAEELLGRLIRFARDDLRLTHLRADTTMTNHRAIRLVKRLGFRVVLSGGDAVSLELALPAS